MFRAFLAASVQTWVIQPVMERSSLSAACFHIFFRIGSTRKLIAADFFAISSLLDDKVNETQPEAQGYDKTNQYDDC